MVDGLSERDDVVAYVSEAENSAAEAENRSCIHEYEENRASIQQDSLKYYKKFRNAALTKSA